MGHTLCVGKGVTAGHHCTIYSPADSKLANEPMSGEHSTIQGRQQIVGNTTKYEYDVSMMKCHNYNVI